MTQTVPSNRRNPGSLTGGMNKTVEHIRGTDGRGTVGTNHEIELSVLWVKSPADFYGGRI